MVKVVMWASTAAKLGAAVCRRNRQSVPEVRRSRVVTPTICHDFAAV
jgi:hypothetical protein